MGISTVSIGFLPSYASIGIAVLIINAMSLWPGVGLGGE
jgi:hypothetical protein